MTIRLLPYWPPYCLCPKSNIKSNLYRQVNVISIAYAELSVLGLIKSYHLISFKYLIYSNHYWIVIITKRAWLQLRVQIFNSQIFYFEDTHVHNHNIFKKDVKHNLLNHCEKLNWIETCANFTSISLFPTAHVFASFCNKQDLLFHFLNMEKEKVCILKLYSYKSLILL